MIDDLEGQGSSDFSMEEIEEPDCCPIIDEDWDGFPSQALKALLRQSNSASLKRLQVAKISVDLRFPPSSPPFPPVTSVRVTNLWIQTLEMQGAPSEVRPSKR